MVQADRQDRDVVEALSEWLKDEAPRRANVGGLGVGFLRSLTDLPTSEAWGGWKYPECSLWAGALNHAQLKPLLRRVAAAPWRYPGRVQVFLMDQEQSYFRLYMFRDDRWQQYAPPPPPDADDQHAW